MRPRAPLGRLALRMKEQEEREHRARERRRRMVVHRANSFEEADRWDLDYWQSQTPAVRLAALVAIRRDMTAIRREEGRTGEKA